MQFTAIGYAVAAAAGSPQRAALDLGFIGAARAVPVILLSPLAGVAADRLPRRAVLFVTNLTMSLAALAFAMLATMHHLSLVALVVISACNAAAQSFDSPVRQSWVPLLVDRAFVGNAIGLNSVAFNAPAVIGPALAGILIAWVGVAFSFYVNAVATLAVVVAILAMRPAPPTAITREPVFTALRTGIMFLLKHPVLRWVILSFFVSALLVRPYSTLAPAFVVNVLQTGPRGLGLALAAIGTGGFIGALATAHFAQREHRALLWLISGVTMSAGVLALGFSQTLPVAILCFGLIGTATLAYLGASNTIIQVTAPDDLRGRAVSVYTMIALGIVPLGAFVVGLLAARIGLHESFIALGAICTVMFIAIYWASPAMQKV